MGGDYMVMASAALTVDVFRLVRAAHTLPLSHKGRGEERMLLVPTLKVPPHSLIRLDDADVAHRAVAQRLQRGLIAR